MTVYRIENIQNGWVYIGLTKRPVWVRWAEHYRAAFKNEKNGRLYRAMRKFGPEAFRYDVIDKRDVSEEDLFILEQLYIEQNNSYWFGYNNTIGGKGYKDNRPHRGRKAQK